MHFNSTWLVKRSVGSKEVGETVVKSKEAWYHCTGECSAAHQLKSAMLEDAAVLIAASVRLLAVLVWMDPRSKRYGRTFAILNTKLINKSMIDCIVTVG